MPVRAHAIAATTGASRDPRNAARATSRASTRGAHAP